MPRTVGAGYQKVCEEGAICCIISVINGPSDSFKREDQPGGSVTVEYPGKRESWEKCNIYKYSIRHRSRSVYSRSINQSI